MLLCVLLFSCKEPVVLEGELRSVGNAPFSELVVKTEDNTIYLRSIKQKKYSAFQGKRVRVWGELDKEEMVSADGKFTQTKLILKTDSLKVIQ